MPVLMKNLTDEQLMTAYVSGKTAAFETLYTRHESPMLRFIQRILGKALLAQAEEVYQDVWLRIIAAQNKYTPPSQGGASWKTWAYTIAHNAAIDRLRADNKYATITPLDDDEDQDPTEWIQALQGQVAHSAEDTAHWQAAGAKLLNCIEGLPIDQRAAFLLHHEEDHSIEEMAEQLCLSFETLKSRLRYAMQKLRHCMRHFLDEAQGIK